MEIILTAQEIFDNAFHEFEGVVELSVLVDRVLRATGNKDTTLTWRTWHNKHNFYYIGNYLVSRMVSREKAHEILNKRNKPKLPAPQPQQVVRYVPYTKPIKKTRTRPTYTYPMGIKSGNGYVWKLVKCNPGITEETIIRCFQTSVRPLMPKGSIQSRISECVSKNVIVKRNNGYFAS